MLYTTHLWWWLGDGLWHCFNHINTPAWFHVPGINGGQDQLASWSWGKCQAVSATAARAWGLPRTAGDSNMEVSLKRGIHDIWIGLSLVRLGFWWCLYKMLIDLTSQNLCFNPRKPNSTNLFWKLDVSIIGWFGLIGGSECQNPPHRLDCHIGHSQDAKTLS